MDIYAFIDTLTQEQKHEFKAALALEFENDLELKINENPTKCPHCNSENVTNRGSCRGIKRYKCKECSKTFNAKTKTAFHHTKKPLETWNKYLDLMFTNQMPLRKIAKATGLNLRTAFFWRHKILNALTKIDAPKLSGIVEADETYFALSYKGQRKGIPRPSRKRGKQVKKRGISKEQVCIVTAIDRSRNTLLQSTCLGRMTIKQVTDTLGPYIASDALLVTDKHSAYPGFAKRQGLTHYALEHRTREHPPPDGQLAPFTGEAVHASLQRSGHEVP